MAPTAPPWPARVIAVAASPHDVARGRPSEFRHQGVYLDGTPSVAAALIEIGRDPESLVLVRSDLDDMPLLDFIDVVHVISQRPVIIAIAPEGDDESVAATVQRGLATSLTMPVTPSKLAQAVKQARPVSAGSSGRLQVGRLELDVDAYRVFWCGTEVHLSPRPFDMLHYLMSAHPRVVSIEELIGEFGCNEGARDRAERVRVNLMRVRHLLAEAHPLKHQPLETVHRVGYRLNG